MSGKIKARSETVNNFLIIQSTTGNWGAESPQSLREMVMRTCCHGMPYGKLLPGPTSSDLCCQDKDGRPMAKACGGFKSSNHKHPPKERGSMYTSLPKCLFFCGVCMEQSLCSKVVTLPWFPFSFGNSQFYDYIKSLHNSHVTFFSEPLFPVVLLHFHQPHHHLVSLSSQALFSLLLYVDSPGCWFCWCYCYYYYRKYLVKQLELKNVSGRER